MKSGPIRSNSGMYFLAFEPNADQNNSEIGHILHSVRNLLRNTRNNFKTHILYASLDR